MSYPTEPISELFPSKSGLAMCCYFDGSWESQEFRLCGCDKEESLVSPL